MLFAVVEFRSGGILVEGVKLTVLNYDSQSFENKLCGIEAGAANRMPDAARVSYECYIVQSTTGYTVEMSGCA